MFSVRQKREISEAIQQILAETNHPELPKGEIEFVLQVKGASSWSWASITNNGACENPTVNPHNEAQDTEFHLALCGQCSQMTNHINGVCQKCKDK